MKKKYLVLSLICVFLLLIAIPKMFTNKQGKNIKISTSALLNKKYHEKINSIYIGDFVDTLHFFKEDDWICNYGDLYFYANNNIINELISDFEKNRSLITVANEYKVHENYGLLENQRFNISFYNEDLAGNKIEFSSLYFGNENYDRSMIYLCNNRNATVYSTENDMYPYFTTKLEFYGNQAFFPLVSNTKEVEKSITKIAINDYTKTSNSIIKYRGDVGFEDYVHKFFSSNGSKYYNQDILESDNIIKIKEIQLFDDKNNVYTLDIYSYFNNMEEQYFIKTNYPKKDSMINYVLEISSWTKSRFDIE